MATFYSDKAFAPIDKDLRLERIGGGFETEVYSTDDRRFLVKLKGDRGGDLPHTLAMAKNMRDIAEHFATCLGPEHTIQNDYLLARDSQGKVQVLVLQPFIQHAHPLAKVDPQTLQPAERQRLARQLYEIVDRTVAFYHERGLMPDLYGLSSESKAQRHRLANPLLFPWHLWNFLIGRNLLSSWNLLRIDQPGHRVVLVDYDLVRWPAPIRRLYFAVRRILCWRDTFLIQLRLG